MADVAVHQLIKCYGAFEVIHGVDFEIKDGEFLVLVGPSGCGKSTLLRCIAGLEEISDGEIIIGGEIVDDLPPKARNIAMVFQNYALYPHMTVRKNMAFSMRLSGVGRAEQDAAVARAAEILGLEPLLERYPRELSGGQRQRVAMGRAIVRDPAVFLFDEPLSNLDAKLRVQMRAEIKALHQRLKATMIYVTHDQIEAMTMADRIVVMRDGYVEQIGTPMSLYDRPENMFVASFIGSPSMNMVEGTVEQDEGDWLWLRSRNGDLWPLPQNSVLSSGDAITIGIRPEHLEIAENGVPAILHVVEPTGPETQAVLAIGEETLTMATRDRLEDAPGTRVKLSVEAEKLHVFDTATGKRVE
ncbi:MAG: sugar ABC transporter ATP-binding protein [Rhizobiaceae bacterium]|nr:sugar ABC transporter ATP-binding protein [Rhizobiaceae bacterium]